MNKLGSALFDVYVVYWNPFGIPSNAEVGDDLKQHASLNCSISLPQIIRLRFHYISTFFCRHLQENLDELPVLLQ